MNELVKQCHLEYVDPPSHNKEYNLFLRRVGQNEYTVDFSYGKIGKSLLNGTKTPDPVNEWAAQDIYEEIYQDKIGKGYKLCGEKSGPAMNVDKFGYKGGKPVKPKATPKASYNDDIADEDYSGSSTEEKKKAAIQAMKEQAANKFGKPTAKGKAKPAKEPVAPPSAPTVDAVKAVFDDEFFSETK